MLQRVFNPSPTPVAGGYQHAGSQASTDQLAAAVASVRGFFFYLSTFTLALPLFVTMLILAPFVALLDRHRCASAAAQRLGSPTLKEMLVLSARACNV